MKPGSPSAQIAFTRLPAYCAALILIITLVGSPLRAQLLIDDFTDGQGFIFTGTTDSNLAAGTMIGGERDIDVVVNMGAGAVSSSVAGGLFNFGLTAGVTGTGLIVWDGPDGDPTSGAIDFTGLASVDLTDGGRLDGFILRIESTDLVGTLVLTVYTDGANASDATLMVPGGIMATTPYFIPFSTFGILAGAGADFTDVGAISLSVTGTALDLTLSLLRAEASVTVTKTDALFIDNDFDAVASPGDTIRYTVVVANPDDDGNASAVGMFYNSGVDTNSGLVVGSVTTDQGTVTTGNTGGDTTVSIDIGTIIDSDSVTITYDVLIDLPLDISVTQISCQGTVTSVNIPGGILSDDTAVGGTTDATVTPITKTIISNFVWNDLNGDGVQDGGAETGIAGVTLEAYFDANNDDMVDGGDLSLGILTTDAGGIYGFGLPNYTEFLIDVTDTGMVVNGSLLTGGADPTPVTLASGLTNDTIDFGYQPNGSIGDFLWWDVNADGVQDGGLEVGLDGVTIDLYADNDSSGTVSGGDTFISTATTAAGGAYDFTSLGPGDYVLDITDTGMVLTGYALTTGNLPYGTTLGSGEDEDGADFGYRGTATLGDFLWWDIDADTVQDGGLEAGIDGVTLDLYMDNDSSGTINGGDVVLSTLTTAAGGGYDFINLPPGDYIVDITDTGTVLTGYALTTANGPFPTILTAAEDENGADFGFRGTGTIGDFLWWDINADTVQDGGLETGINGVTIDLYIDNDSSGSVSGGDVLLRTLTTAGGGAFDFINLPPDDYVLTVTDTGLVLAGYALTTANDPFGTTLAAGGDVNTADFGYRGTGTIGDFVWWDVNADTTQDGGVETGFDGVTIDLYIDNDSSGTVSGGDTLLETQTTAGGGAYDFINLPPDDYVLDVTDTGTVLTAYLVTTGNQPFGTTLTAGEDENGGDFGYRGTGTIGDFLWWDINADTVQDGGLEVGIDGVTLDLYIDNDSSGTVSGGDTLLLTQTTAGGGAYDFANLPPDDYVVTVTDTGAALAGYALTTGNDPFATNLTNGEDENNGDFGYRGTGTIGDFVWYDPNGDTVQDGGLETGFDGVTLDLYIDNDSSGTVSGGDTLLTTQTTAGGGAYDFTNLPPDDYVVDVTDTGTVLTTYALTTANAPFGTTLTAGEDENGGDFGYRGTASIGDFLWWDINADGVQDGGMELGIDGVTIDLYIDNDDSGTVTGGDTLLTTQTTAAGGAYDFTNLGPEDYVLDVTDTGAALAGYALTTANNPFATNLTAGEDENNGDFGYRGTGTIGDFVWYDADGDTVQDGGLETGFDGVTLDLYIDTDSSGTVTGGDTLFATQTTAGGGAYDFTNLPPDDYVVDVTDTGTVLTTYALTTGNAPFGTTLTAGEDENGGDFGYRGTASIGDFLWWDANANGVQDGGMEVGIDGVTIDLYIDNDVSGTVTGGDTLLTTQTTAAGGAYDFTNLGPENYVLDVTDTGAVLAGYALTTANNPFATNLVGGEDENNGDFGYRGTGTIGDFLWTDSNGNTAQDGGSETGIDGVTLDLYIDNDSSGTVNGGDTLVGTQTTAAGGAYDFTNLPPEDYLVDVTDTGVVLAGYALTTANAPFATTLAAGGDENGGDFGYRGTGTIGDFLWWDVNANGAQNGGLETGIDGVTIDLYLDNDSSGTVTGGDTLLSTQTTAAGGAYDFTNLVPADYVVDVTDTGAALAGYALTTANQPFATTLAPAADENSADFGYRGTGTIGDFLWWDVNADTVQDGGLETGLDGVTLDLHIDNDASGTVTPGDTLLLTETTAAGGAYDFINLPPNNYVIDITDTATALAGYALTTANAPFATNLSAAEDENGGDFGYRGTATLGDFVWIDRNGDTVQDGGLESGIDGVTLDLYIDNDASGTVTGGDTLLATQTTAAGGAYDFINLPANTYVVDVTDTGLVLAGFALTTANAPFGTVISNGEDENGGDFGYRGTASIGDFVWFDFNADTVQDGGPETGIDGVTLDLYQDNDSSGTVTGGDTLLETQTTAAGGAYDFIGLAPADYVVTITDTGARLTGYLLTTANEPFATTLTAAEDEDGGDFGYRGSGSIGDFVWSDLNSDGVQDGGAELGFDGVTLDLHHDVNGDGILDGGDVLMATTTTAGGGLYDFINLPPDDYIAEVTDTGAVLTGLAVTTPEPLGTTLAAAQDFNGADFGYGPGMIGDFVWFDFNGDGIQDGGIEAGIDGVTLDLYRDVNGDGILDGGDILLTTETTAAGGAYQFVNLTSDNYLVDVTDTGLVLAGYNLTTTNPFAAFLAAGGSVTNADFGYRGTGTIGDFLWWDINGDDVQDGGLETGIDGVTLDLYLDVNADGTIDGGDVLWMTQTTAAGGAYDFDGLPPGTYLVSVTDTGGALAGYTPTIAGPKAVTLAADEDHNGADFGYQGTGTIGDFVWWDTNADGLQDGGIETGLDGVTLDIYLDNDASGTINGADSLLATTTTAAAGAYDFVGLPPGDYLVTVTDTGAALNGYAATTATTIAIALAADEDHNAADFGNRGTGTIGDLIYEDQNADGDPTGEPGIDGVTLDIYLDDMMGGGTLLATVTTAAGGAFDFINLRPGDYRVEVTDTAGIVAGYVLTGGTNPLAVSLTADQDYDAADFGYVQDPSIGLAKQAGVTVNNGDGTYSVPFTFVVANLGQIPLTDVQITDNLNLTFTGAATYTVVTGPASGSLTTNAGFDGGADTNLLSGLETLPAGATATVSYTVRFDPMGEPSPFTNTATAAANSEGGPVTDISDDGTQPDSDHDGDPGGPDEDDPTPINFDETPQIAIAKSAGPVQDIGGGVYETTLTMNVENVGNVQLSEVQVSDPLAATFPAPVTYTVVTAPTTTGGLTANKAYDGQADNELLQGTDTLAASDRGTISFTVQFELNGAVGPFTNSAEASGTGPSGGVTNDTSDNGTQPDPDGDGDPSEAGEDDPTPIDITLQPQIGIAKQASPVEALGGGVFQTTLTLTVTNYGNTLLQNIQVSDDLAASFPAPATYVLSSAVAASGSLAASGTFDGNIDLDLLDEGTSSLAIGGQETITVTLDITPNANSGSYTNQAFASGESPGGAPTTDTSHNGNEPDPDGDRNPDEADENDPTPIETRDNPVIGIAKQANVVLDLGGGHFETTLTIQVENLGNTDLTAVQVTDDLRATFPLPVTYTIVAGPTSPDFTVNPDYDGETDLNLLEGVDTLAVGVAGTLSLSVRFQPMSLLGPYNNQALASGQGPGAVTTTDHSDDGAEPDGNGNGDPNEDGENDPTPIVIMEQPVIGLAKQAGTVSDNGDGSYTVPLTFIVENHGNVALSAVQITDDLTVTFPAPASYSVLAGPASGSLTVNPAYDGDGDTNLLAGTDRLEVGATASVSLTLRLEPAIGASGPYTNSANASGVGPGGGDTNDQSDDGTNTDDNGDGTPDEGTPTVISIDENPQIALAKTASPVLDLGAGTYETVITLTVENVGKVQLNDVQVRDNLDTTFPAPASYAVQGPPGTTGGLTANKNYDGSGDSDLLQGMDSLIAGEQASISITVQFQLNGAVGPFNNTATATGTGTGGGTTNDTSDNGTNPDPNGNGDPGDPGEDDPTPIDANPQPQIGVSKHASPVRDIGGGTYRTAITLVVENLGNTELENIQVSDDLRASLPNPIGITITSAVTASGTLTANGAYNGEGDINLLQAGSSTLAIGARETIAFTFDFTPNDVIGPYFNQAMASAESPSGTPTTDDSHDGDEPDPDGDGNPDEPGENEPTPLDPDPRPVIGIAKQAGNVLDLGDGLLEVELIFQVANLGNTELVAVQVTDDLIATFPPPVTYTLPAQASSADFTINPGYDGATDFNLLDGSDTLAIGGTGLIRLTLQFRPMDMLGPFMNQALASGLGPGSVSTTDLSDNGAEPDTDHDGQPNEDDENDPTPIAIEENPIIGLAKQAGPVSNNGDGSNTVALTFIVENLGNVALTGVQITDDLAATFPAPVTYSVIAGPTSGSLAVNAAYDGNGDRNLLAGTDRLEAGADASVTLTVRLEPNGTSGPYTNIALASGHGPGGGDTSDASNDGTNPDDNGDGMPEEDDPTQISVAEAPQIALSKAASPTLDLGGGAYETTLTFIVENLGNVQLNDIQVRDSLETTFPAPASFDVVTVPTTTGGLIANKKYDGRADSNLLQGMDSLVVGDRGTISITVRFEPNGTGPFSNTAIAEGSGPSGGGTTDTSSNGSEPDPNGDGDPDGPGEDAPTPIDPSPQPQIAIAKQASPVESLGGGSYRTDITLTVENLGNTTLADIQVSDNLRATFPQPVTIAVAGLDASGTLTANGAYDGEGEVNLLQAGASTLAVGGQETITFTVEFTPNSSVGPYNNQAVASGESPAGTPTTDTSNNGNQTDPDGDGNPDEIGENTPTPIDSTLTPVLGIAKRATSVQELGGGDYEVELTIQVENLGNTELTSLQVTDDLLATFPPPVTYTLTAGPSSPGLSINPGYNGATDLNLLDGSDTLAIGATGTISLTLQFQPLELLGPFSNQALASAQGPGNVNTTDLSDDGSEPDPDHDGEPNENGENDPTPIAIVEEPVVGLSKQAGPVADNDDGSYTVAFTFIVENFGNVSLNELQITDDLATTFPSPVSYTVLAGPTSGTLAVNPAYDGSGDTNLLLGSDTLERGADASVTLTVRIVPSGQLRTFSNLAEATGIGPGGGDTSDVSDDGTNPDDNDDGVPDESEPTVISLAENPRIGISKQASPALDQGDGSFETQLTFTVENLGNVNLSGVQVTDNLVATFPAPATFTVLAAPVTTGPLIANPGYNGGTDVEMLTGNDVLSTGETATITVAINFRPNASVGPYLNRAEARGTSPTGTGVSDQSDHGSDPDPNGNGNPGDSDENDPTSINPALIPVIGLTKVTSPVLFIGGETYETTFTLEVSNVGNTPLESVQVTDDLLSTFPVPLTISLDGVVQASGTLTANPGYDGISDTQLLTAAASSLAIGARETISLTVFFTLNGASGPFFNGALASGDSPGGMTTTDESNHGTNPDSNGNGNPSDPNENLPTPIDTSLMPVIGVAKQATAVVYVGEGNFETTFTILVENLGNAILDNVQVTDDLVATFPTPASYTIFAAPVALGLTVNPAYNGGSDQNLLAGTDTLAPGDRGEIAYTVHFNPAQLTGPFFNQAVASGSGPDAVLTTDLSNDGRDGDPDGDGEPNEEHENDPTPVFVPIPVLGLAKNLIENINNQDKTYTVGYELYLENTGNRALDGLQVSDNLAETYPAPAGFSVLSVTSSELTINPDYTGTAPNTNLLLGSDHFALAETATITLRVLVTPGTNLGPYFNTATGTGTTVEGFPISDATQDGTDPDPDNDGPDNNSEPTPVTFGEIPAMGVSKALTMQHLEQDGSGTLRFEISATNMGDVRLHNLNLTDDLRETFPLPTDYTILALTSATLAVNPSYTGQGSGTQLLAGTDSLEIGASGTVILDINVQPNGNLGTFYNSVTGEATTPGDTEIVDISQDGRDPDPEGDGAGNNSEPTPILLAAIVPVLTDIFMILMVGSLLGAGLVIMRRRREVN